MDVLKEWAGLIAVLISIGGTLFGWMNSGAKTNAKALSDFKESVAEDLNDHGSRIQAIEGELKHLPDIDAVHKLQLTMKDIQVEMAGIKAGTEVAVRVSRRLEEYLITKAGGTA